jgi:hypothetical protein
MAKLVHGACTYVDLLRTVCGPYLVLPVSAAVVRGRAGACLCPPQGQDATR